MRCAIALPLSVMLAGAGPPQQRVQLAFHSGFLMNLHHFLYDLGIHPEKLEKINWTSAPSPAETATLRNAMAFYRDNYAQRDLLFDEQTTSIKTALSVADARRDTLGLALPPALASVLDRAAPIYERCIWPQQDAGNRLWIAEAKRLDERYGAAVQEGVSRYLQSGFPLTPVRIDIVVETGKRQGGYTDTQTVIPGGRASYQGIAALEMVYHEVAHIASTARLEEMIEARLKETRRPLDSDLWHAVQFYTVGKVTKDAVKRLDGIDYEPYADKAGLFTGYWSPFLPLLENDWRAYMEGRLSLQQAVGRMVDRLPAGQ